MHRVLRTVDRESSVARFALAAAAVALLLGAPRAFAQSSDVPPPPRLDRPGPLVFTITPKDLEDAAPDPSKLTASQLAAAAAPARPPNAARLAPPDGREEPIEEIVVLGGDWRLPDLGSRWRAKQQAAEEDAKGRAHVTFLPLYDPERPSPTLNSLHIPPELARMGYIDLFRVRFGRHKSEPPP